MKTYKVVQVEDKFFIERKDKKTGSRVLVFDKDKKAIEFDTKEKAEVFITRKEF